MPRALLEQQHTRLLQSVQLPIIHLRSRRCDPETTDPPGWVGGKKETKD